MANEIGLGIIGSGFMARTYAECLARYTRQGRLVAVSGGTRAPQLAADYGVDYVPAPEELMAREDVAGIIITTPEMVHLEQTRLAAAAGKHILVEKPMAPDVAQCEAMIAACTEAKVILMVVQSQRFRAVHRQAHELVREGRIGTLRQIRHWGQQPLQYSLDVVTARPFYLDPQGGGLYMGYTVHGFDLVRWLAGSEARSVYAQVGQYGQHQIPNLSTMAQLTFQNGVTAQLWACLEMPGQTFPGSEFRTQLVGDKGLLDFDGYSHLDLGTAAGWERVWTQPPINPMDPADPIRLESFSSMIQDFIDAILKDSAPSVTGEEGRAAVELCQAALKSARTGQVVSLPLELDH
jgi:myo-inositol 2-dehydrogenase/D-chiro-inositol 1-dehydrogenase